YNGLPNTNLRLFFYARAHPSTSSYGEGQRYMGFLDIKTDAAGNVGFVFKSSRPGFTAAPGEVIAATAHNPSFGTSEFSRAVFVGPTPTPEATITFVTPRDGEYLRAFKSISGRYNQSQGINRVELVIQRRADKKYFTGTGFRLTSVRLPTELSFGKWVYRGTLPSEADLPEGQYSLFAVAYNDLTRRATAAVDVLVDRSGPRVSFVAPQDGQELSAFSSIAGRAVEDAGSGLARVELVIRRRSDGKYFSGSQWVEASVRLPTLIDGNNWRYNGSLPSGDDQYVLTAVAYDRLGNRGDATISVTVQATTTTT
ncbi:MAG: hypothetical protein JWN98_104, partial [Abditibacteriota bacterium]|nr:hypothetical protein [Abditibacteriota bacterium]